MFHGRVVPHLLINDRGKDTILLRLWLQEELQHVQIVRPGICLLGKHKRATNCILHETKSHIDFGREPLLFGEFIWLLLCPDLTIVSIDDATDMKYRLIAEQKMIHQVILIYRVQQIMTHGCSCSIVFNL